MKNSPKLATLIILLLLFFCFTGCDRDDKNDAETVTGTEVETQPRYTSEETFDSYTIYYKSYGDGTCCVCDILTDIDCVDPYTLDIPAVSPEGDRVIDIKSHFAPREIPIIIAADDFESLAAKVRELYGGGLAGEFYYAKFLAYFCASSDENNGGKPTGEKSLSKCKDEDAKKQLLEAYPFAEAVDFYVFDPMSNDVEMIKIAETIKAADPEYDGFEAVKRIITLGEACGADMSVYYAFYQRTGGAYIREINIPDGVTSIGAYAFEGCTGLTSLSIPDSVTSIGKYAFARCTGVASLSIPDSVTSIGESAFEGCTGLTSIIIPDGVASIDQSAFAGCTQLTSIIIPDGVTSIEQSAFANYTWLTSITIPDSVTSIGEGAFEGCIGLASIIIPDGVTSIGEYTFKGCTGLTTISIPGGVTSIGESAFAGCTGLTSIIIPGGVTSIGAGAFRGCTGLTSIGIPDGVTTIGNSAFERCTGLTSIIIPDSVISIGEYAFAGCTGLTSVTFNGTKEEWGALRKDIDWISSDVMIHCADGDF